MKECPRDRLPLETASGGNVDRVYRPPLMVIIVLYILLGVLYSAILPVFEAPDEQQHYGYIQHVASDLRLPPWGERSPAGHEASQPPLYYTTAALLTAWRSHARPVTLKHNHFYGNYQAPGTVNDNKNVFLHDESERFPWRGAVLTIHLARFVNLLFGALTVSATYLLARATFGDQAPLPLCAAALVAFMPQFLFVSSAINNDAAVSALSTIALWLLVRGIREGYSLSVAAELGVAAGLASLSKVSALGLLPLTLAVMSVRLWRQSTGSQLHRRLRLILRYGIVFLAVAFTISGWWYVRNSFLYDDPLGTRPHLQAWWKHEDPLPVRVIWDQLPGVGLSFVAGFGMGNVHLPIGFYVFMASLTFLAATGFVAWAVHAWRSGRHPGPRAYSLASVSLWLILVFAALVRWMQLLKAPLGRLLFPAIGALAVLTIWGLDKGTACVLQVAAAIVSSRPRSRHWVLIGLMAALLCFAGAAPVLTIRAAYARPSRLSKEQIAARYDATDIRFNDRIHLTGYLVSPRSTCPGEEILVTLCWEALDQMNEEYAYFVHLLGRHDAIVGARDTYPGLGRFPTTQWTPDASFCDMVRVPVHKQAPAPAVYDVEIGWYKPNTGKRLRAYDADGNSRELVLLDRLRVAPKIPPAVYVPRRVSAEFGNQITLVGYQLSQREIRRSNPLTVTLFWEPQTAVEEDYTVFVHLGPTGVQPYAQDDSQPRGGAYPTSFWEAGEMVIDQHILDIPENVPSGSYRLSAGLYAPSTGERLTATNVAGQRLPGDAVPLAEVQLP